MLSVVSLPIVMALSAALPAPTTQAPATPVQNKSEKTAQVDTLTCPLTGKEIPSCCCPVKK